MNYRDEGRNLFKSVQLPKPDDVPHWLKIRELQLKKKMKKIVKVDAP